MIHIHNPEPADNPKYAGAWRSLCRLALPAEPAHDPDAKPCPICEGVDLGMTLQAAVAFQQRTVEA